MPKTAILQKDGDFIFCFFLRQKTIPVDSIQYVHYPEIGTFANRGDDIFSSLHILKHDIRTLTITYTENGAARQFHLACIRNASAVAAAIDSIVKQHRRTLTAFTGGNTYSSKGNTGEFLPVFPIFARMPLHAYDILYKRAFLARQHPELPFQYGRGKQRRKFCRSAICGVQFCPGNRRQNSPCRAILCAYFFAVSGQNLRGRMQFFAAFPEQLGHGGKIPPPWEHARFSTDFSAICPPTPAHSSARRT